MGAIDLKVSKKILEHFNKNYRPIIAKEFNVTERTVNKSLARVVSSNYTGEVSKLVDEDLISCSGAWMNSSERQWYVNNKNNIK